MESLSDSFWSSNDFTKSSVQLTDAAKSGYSLRERTKQVLKKFKFFIKETTVEPCLFLYMLCIALSSLAVQNMHLEKSCRVNYNFGDVVCDRIRDRNTTGLETELNKVQSLVAKVIAWKFPLQTGIPAVMVIFVGAWSDKHKKRKICILFPMIGEIATNIGLLLATYYFQELSLTATALIEALPPALTGSYIIMFAGMYSFISDRTTIENRTFRIGIVSMFVNLGTPVGTALSGIILRAMGYYGVFSLLIVLHSISFAYGLFRLEDVVCENSNRSVNSTDDSKKSVLTILGGIFGLVASTVLVLLKPRLNNGRTKIILILVLYIIMVGPLYGDSQVSYLYAIRKFSFTEVEYSLYGTINIVLGFTGTTFCIAVLSKMMKVKDSLIGGLAGASRIAACFAFAFSPTRRWFYAAPLFNIFSNAGLIAIRSIATKSVPTEEVAKLSALIGVTEAIAPSIYMPASSYIYVSTIEYFPGAFYMFDATLTFVALGLFSLMYFLEGRRNAAVSASKTKEEYAKSNEISAI